MKLREAMSLKNLLSSIQCYEASDGKIHAGVGFTDPLCNRNINVIKKTKFDPSKVTCGRCKYNRQYKDAIRELDRLAWKKSGVKDFSSWLRNR